MLLKKTFLNFQVIYVRKAHISLSKAKNARYNRVHAKSIKDPKIDFIGYLFLSGKGVFTTSAVIAIAVKE